VVWGRRLWQVGKKKRGEAGGARGAGIDGFLHWAKSEASDTADYPSPDRTGTLERSKPDHGAVFFSKRVIQEWDVRSISAVGRED